MKLTFITVLAGLILGLLSSGASGDDIKYECKDLLLTSNGRDQWHPEWQNFKVLRKSETVLHAKCLRNDGKTYRCTRINLNDCIGLQVDSEANTVSLVAEEGGYFNMRCGACILKKTQKSDYIENKLICPYLFAQDWDVDVNLEDILFNDDGRIACNHWRGWDAQC
ncbi:hypothetical protein VD0002_g1170 [Verticillium dahliae]|uniref:Cyanovirin-N domain-containing protein n=2 Tax=Verticillium dahliae TaxID=27337 RepID=G2XC26_VERDV|nr:uncharacterized protein VDAG_07604 [Verticillium dahliae VdLs.17]KAF3349517.1 hypothetical protein VdG2_02363 [Verticillium dahliae VDG2]KAH6699269.1 hypothetical protein EV126DRAFT_523422 [Verticillium dahliae]EGY16440.1 hypothetical protein VDAG_07604 [Verticillium dahliae VdLs.17]PNH32803.1 hypothetical protein BJF96_g4020 [Verticillium dahliae]PNH40474.1 hypothetical protein VD0004_g6512 [Verticillium dahliae]